MNNAVGCFAMAVALMIAGCDNSGHTRSAHAMGEDAKWNETSREELRETIRKFVLGEVRLSKNEQAEIIDICREAHIEGECPENEWDNFVQFSKDELNKAVASHLDEQAGWPKQTDCEFRRNGVPWTALGVPGMTRR